MSLINFYLLQMVWLFRLSLYFFTKRYGFGFSIFLTILGYITLSECKIILNLLKPLLINVTNSKCIAFITISRVKMYSPFCELYEKSQRRSKKKILCVSTYEAIMFCVRFCIVVPLYCNFSFLLFVLLIYISIHSVKRASANHFEAIF